MSRPAKRLRADHSGTAAKLRANPGQWLLVNIYRTADPAANAARAIRTGERIPVYLPAGAFEARTETVDDGIAVHARYTGWDSPAV